MSDWREKALSEVAHVYLTARLGVDPSQRQEEELRDFLRAHDAIPHDPESLHAGVARMCAGLMLYEREHLADVFRAGYKNPPLDTESRNPYYRN